MEQLRLPIRKDWELRNIINGKYEVINLNWNWLPKKKIISINVLKIPNIEWSSIVQKIPIS